MASAKPTDLRSRDAGGADVFRPERRAARENNVKMANGVRGQANREAQESPKFFTAVGRQLFYRF